MRKKIFLFAFLALITAVSIFSNPVISNVSVQTVYGTSVVITWTTDVASTSRVTYGTSTPPSNIEENLNYVTEHRIVIEGLSICTPYFFSVTSNDGSGATTDDNNGNYYSFTTGLDTQPVYNASAPEVPKTLPVETTVFSTITVTENKPIEDINVTIGFIDIGTAWPLQIYIISPDNTRIPLSLNNDSDNQFGADYSDLVLDDEAEEYLIVQDAPFTGTFKPNGQLSHLYGKNAQGTWTLEIININTWNEGTLYSWGIQFSFPYEFCAPHARISDYVINDACTGTGNGDEDGVIDSGEDVILPVTLYNDGNGNLSGVGATVTTSTFGVTIVDGNASFPNINKNNSQQSTDNISFSVNVSKSCGEEINLNFHIYSNERPGGWDYPLTLEIGNSPATEGVALDEDFTFGIPSGWTIIDGGVNDPSQPPETWSWTDVDVTMRNNIPPVNDPFAIVDSDRAGENAQQDEQLITTILDLSDADSVTLEYDTVFAWYDEGGDEKGDIDIRSSLTSGEWVNIKRYQGQSTPADWEFDPAVHDIVDITDYAAGASDVQLRFHYYDAEWDFFWIVDNIKVSYTVPTSCSMNRCCPAMTTPAITNISDDDFCSQSGITITFTTSTPATRHDLYVDNVLTLSDVNSPIHYNPSDTSQHSYKIRAVNVYEDCYVESSSSDFTDENRTPGTPSAPTVQDNTPCATAGVSIAWGAVSQATYYDLLVDGTTTISNVTSPYTYEPHDNNSHTYQIRGRNDDCTGQWSSETSGTDENHTPATPSTAPAVSDKDACQTNGVNITWSAISGATGYDLRVDGTTIVENVTSPYTYLPNNNTQHSYEIRGKYVNASPSYTCYGGWSPAQNGTDINDTPGQPTITGITDNDACATSGITINYTAGSQATSHDLYKDGVLAVSGFVSGATYTPNDNSSHTYVIRAKKNTCYIDSTGVSGTDVNDTPGQPVINNIVDVSPCATSGIQVNYTAGSGATSHDLYKDGALAVTGYVSGATYSPGDNSSHTYVIRAKKNTCYRDSAGVAGTDVNDTPGAPSITSVVDVDPCATNGIQVNYIAGTGATSHDLYKDGLLAVTNYVSGATYQPGDNSSHNYVVRAKKNTCYTDSNSIAQSDTNLKPSTLSAPVVSDIDACATTGVVVTWGTSTQATGYDLRVDGVTVLTNVTSPYTYYPGDNNSHTYEVRGKNATCVGDWSSLQSGTDQNLLPPAPSAPVVSDVDACATSGVSISWSGVPNATQYDLRVDGVTIVTNVTSPYTYQPQDNSSHTYEIRGKNATCLGDWSPTGSGTDEDSKPDTPVITSVVDKDGCASDGVIISWDNVSLATGYDLLVDGTTTITDVTSPYTHIPGNSDPHTYQVRGKNAVCVGEWSIFTSYSNSGGSGDRTSSVTVTSNALAGTVSMLVDGNKTSSNVYFGGGTVVGKYITFDFGSGNSRVINEAKYYQGSSVTQGVWKWQGSNDGSSWTDIGSSFTLGGATTQTITTLVNNSSLYRYYRLFGVSGNSNSGPYVYEFEFKINSQVVGVSGTDINNTPGAPSITSITDDNACQQSGIYIYYTAGSGGIEHDLYKDGNLAVGGYVSGNLYNPGDSLEHSYVIRAKRGTCYTDSTSQNFTDVNDTVGAPSITSIVDEDGCAQSGIRVYYNPGSGANIHSLWRDGVKVVNNYASGALYNPNDSSSHSYVVRAEKGVCYNNSTAQNFTDVNNPVGTPTISSVVDVDPCATSGVSITWGSVSGATGYDLRVDGVTVVTNVTSPYTYQPGNNSSHNYEVRAKNVSCTGSWSAPVSGTDANGTPSAISLTASDNGAGCGVLITFSGGAGATQFDLYVDGGLAQSNITSGYIYTPIDTNSHNYVVRGVNGSCFTNSNTSAVADPGCGVPPPEIATGSNYNWPTANQTTQIMAWNSDPSATGYRVYRGVRANLANLCSSSTDFCTRYDGTSTSLDVTTDSPQTIDSTNRVVYYLIVGYNAAGEGAAGNTTTCGARVVNTTGNCP